VYVQDDPKSELSGKLVFVDPGKRTLFTMMDNDTSKRDKDRFFSYTNKMHVKMNKRLKYQRVIANFPALYREQHGMTEEDHSVLTGLNGKSCRPEEFRHFVNARETSDKIEGKMYREKKYRQYRWYAHINKKRAEDTMLNMIDSRYPSSEYTIIMGDWSPSTQMKHFISTPNLGLKRKLKERFRVYDIDEFRTSKLAFHTQEKTKCLYLPDKKNKMRKRHPILTYQMENNRKGCINRDKNACKNIQLVFDSIIETGERPERFRRNYKLDDGKSKTPTAKNERAVK